MNDRLCRAQVEGQTLNLKQQNAKYAEQASQAGQQLQQAQQQVLSALLTLSPCKLAAVASVRHHAHPWPKMSRSQECSTTIARWSSLSDVVQNVDPNAM